MSNNSRKCVICGKPIGIEYKYCIICRNKYPYGIPKEESELEIWREKTIREFEEWKRNIKTKYELDDIEK